MMLVNYKSRILLEFYGLANIFQLMVQKSGEFEIA
jgi:hypothetical protein